MFFDIYWSDRFCTVNNGYQLCHTIQIYVIEFCTQLNVFLKMQKKPSINNLLLKALRLSLGN